MGRKRHHTRASNKVKQISRRLFEDVVYKILTGQISKTKGATMCGFSKPTFEQRFRQFTEPEVYGGVPEDFFIEDLPKRKPKIEQEKIELPDLSKYL